MKELIRRLAAGERLTDEELLCLLCRRSDALSRELSESARAVCDSVYGRRVFLRGLLEIGNHCYNDCFYCGIRRSNTQVIRYRLQPEEIIACCAAGYAVGLRTFVLQGGEDSWFTDKLLCEQIAAVKGRFPDCAVTLSLGERSPESYRRLFHAGADRYLLRHESANPEHYEYLHPPEMSYKNRMQCLVQIKSIGYQVGCGFMVGSPGQTVEHLVKDLAFVRDFRPHMVGIGPFLPHKNTPFAGERAGSVELTLYLLSIVRLLVPDVLLPATTALHTAAKNGYLQALMAGANVIMPNLSPQAAREKYMLYDGKNSSGDAVESVERLIAALTDLGYCAQPGRGDCLREQD